MAEAADRGWVKAIGRKLRDDLGDAPTLPKEMLDLLEQMKRATPAKPSGKGARDRRQKP
jgi:hypothetical protein